PDTATPPSYTLSLHDALPIYVKDLDGIGLVKMAAGLRDGRFLSGDEIKSGAPKLVIGATASPFAKPMDADVVKTVDKISAGAELDRKSTRLNSSHLVISYAVF